MWWSRRTVLAAAVAVAGCGFRPAYAPDGPATGLRGDVEVQTPDSRAGFALTRQLEQRLGLPEDPAYVLRTDVELGASVTGMPENEVAVRRIIVSGVAYTLSQIDSGEIVRRGRVQNFAGYSSTSTTVATQFAQEDALERVMALLADQIVAELIATAPDWRQ